MSNVKLKKMMRSPRIGQGNCEDFGKHTNINFKTLP